MDDYYSIRLNRWLTSLKIQADTLPACVNCTSIRFYFIFIFFISIICKIVEYKYGIVNEKLHVVSFREIF